MSPENDVKPVAQSEAKPEDKQTAEIPKKTVSLIHDPAACKLGKRERKWDRRTLALARYLRKEILPAVPAAVDYTKGITSFSMMLNDVYGDCTIAACGHAIQIWTANTGSEVTVPDADILHCYEKWDGYVLGDPSTDQGGVELVVLNKWRKNGLFGNDILGYAAVNASDMIEVKQSINLFGGVYIGLALPITAQNQDVWDYDPSAGSDADPGSWGGHAVYCGKYDADGSITCITWGGLKKMTSAFWSQYCVAPNTLILTSDLRWVEAGDLRTGDGLVGFDESPFAGKTRHWRGTSVESCKRYRRPCYELTFEDGTNVTCSDEHSWLVANSTAHWVKTENLVIRNGQSSHVVKPLDTWQTIQSRDGGYIAAAFDGEASLSQLDLRSGKRGIGVASFRTTFVQRNNSMLTEVKRILADNRIRFTEHKRKEGVRAITIGNRDDVFRLLGSFRPIRLLDNFDANLPLGQIRKKTVRLMNKTFVGVREVVGLRTGTGTYIANGLASHNCDESYAILGREWMTKKGSPLGFSYATMEADLAAVRAA